MKRGSRSEGAPAQADRSLVPDRVAVEPLLPVAIPHTSARLARGIRAGRWVFASGQAGTDYINGLAPDVVQAERPLNGESRYKREARRTYDNVKEVLAEVGADIPDVVRVDQYYTTERAMHPYHEVRHEVFGKQIPPSTSNLHRRFSRTGQTIEIQVMAVVPGSGIKVKHETFKPSYDISPVSGYSPALSAGDFRFVPGQTGEARKDGEGPLDPEVRHPRALWRQWPIKLETEYIIKRKLVRLSRRRRRESRQRGESAGLPERPRRCPGLQRSLALALQEQPAGDHHHRNDQSRLRHPRPAHRDQHHLARDQGQDQAGDHSPGRSHRPSTVTSRPSKAATCCSCRG